MSLLNLFALLVYFMLPLYNNGEAATCTDCHKSHFIVKGTDSRSTVYRLNIQNTCGACHTEIKKGYSFTFAWLSNVIDIELAAKL